MTAPSRPALVHSLRFEAPAIVSMELRPLAPATSFPVAVEAGAHVDLHLSEGITRSYSLINPGESHRYVVAVMHDPQSRGGSRFVHESLRVGQVVHLGGPRNHFSLDEAASNSVLLAGGIGITPIYAMLQRLARLGRRAHLVYCARSRAQAAFVDDIKALVAESAGALSAQLLFRDEQGARPDLVRLLGGHAPDAHVYGCGPASMLGAFECACTQLGYAHVHLERFAAAVPPGASPARGYDVELRKSGRTVHVPPGVALLDALTGAGLNPEFSCREGVCGACETRVISGDVDHRDSILTKREREANRSMMICVSSCRSGRLVLDC